jgi:hypothetical protein
MMNNATPLNTPNTIPLMRGINVNGALFTIEEIAALDDRTFRELFLAVVISLIGGVYSPSPLPTEEPEVNVNETVMTAAATGTAEVTKDPNFMAEEDPED